MSECLPDMSKSRRAKRNSIAHNLMQYRKYYQEYFIYYIISAGEEMDSSSASVVASEKSPRPLCERAVMRSFILYLATFFKLEFEGPLTTSLALYL